MVKTATLAAKHEMEKIEMRAAYCQALMDAAEKNDKVVMLECDVMNSMGTNALMKKYPGRSIDCGIMEANTLGVAAGMSATGLIPFFHTFGVFATRRVFDQAFLSCAYAGLNVKIVGGDAGVSAAFNGGTHMPFEDVGLMRNIPGITILEPSDSSMYSQIIPQMVDKYGVFYIRSPRRNVIQVYGEGNTFRIGEAATLREGADVTIIACGVLVVEALKAADVLAAEGVSARVVDMFTIKPLDEKCILAAAKETGAIVTAENHNQMTGLGAAVACFLGKNCPVPQEMVGVDEEFGEVGPQDYLMKRFGMTADNICAKARAAVARKRGK